MSGRYSVDALTSGRYLILDRRSGLSGVYAVGGLYLHGGLRLADYAARELIRDDLGSRAAVLSARARS
jgi:hypothetical protein